MGDASYCERETGMAESGGADEPGRAADERSRAAVVLAETEPFFRDVMGVYVDLLCRGEREVSRLLFRSGVRFAAAVHGMHRAAGRRAATHPAAAARRHLERCLFALWSAQQRDARQPDARHGAINTAPLFERGLVMLSALRGISAPRACGPAENVEHKRSTGPPRRPKLPVPPKERPGREEPDRWIPERTSSPQNR